MPGFGGASKVVKTEKLHAGDPQALSPDERFDSRGYLTARLMDMVVGDWDRGHLQWWFGRFGEKHDHLWRPIPHDRDWAFANHNGFIYSLIHPNVPWFVLYQSEYLSPTRSASSTAWGQDRQLLQDLDRPAFDSTARWLQSVLTDSVIDDAVAQLPPPEQKLYGARMRKALRGRRNALPALAAQYFRVMAGQADVHAVAVPSIITIRRHPDSLSISIRTRDADAETYYQRRFDRASTREVRLYMDGGPDSVAIAGAGNGIMVRLVSGANGDVLVDQHEAHAGPTQVYDGGHPVQVAHGSPLIDSRRFTQPTLPPTTLEPERQPADFLLRNAGSWCAPISSGAFATGSGLTVKPGSVQRLRLPARSVRDQQTGNIGFNFGPNGVLANYLVSVRATGGSPIWSLGFNGTSAQYTWFYGIGNETPHHLPDNDFRARQAYLAATPTVAFVPSEHVTVTLGTGLRYWDTERRPLFFRETQPYGSGGFGTINGTFDAVYDFAPNERYRHESRARRTVRACRAGRLECDVEAYGTVHAEVSGFLVLRPLPTERTCACASGATSSGGRRRFRTCRRLAARLPCAATTRGGSPEMRPSTIRPSSISLSSRSRSSRPRRSASWDSTTSVGSLPTASTPRRGTIASAASGRRFSTISTSSR